jgi:hypothetical protein
MTVLRDMFANELPTAIYFCATAAMLSVYAVCALSLLSTRSRPGRAAPDRRAQVRSMGTEPQYKQAMYS